jgi:hypothetical protein
VNNKNQHLGDKMELRIAGYSLTSLAMFPQPCYESDGSYFMYEYKLGENLELKWYKKIVKDDNGYFRVEIHDNYETAVSLATAGNLSLIENIQKLDLSEADKLSLKLKVEKSVASLSRRLNEEKLMLNEAIKRNQKYPKPILSSLIVPDNLPSIQEALFAQLTKTPYIEIARLQKLGITLRLEANSKWIKVKHTLTTAKYAYREKIARGFGFSGVPHWGETKAAIRQILLPRANKLLQLSSVKRMLDEALANGHRVLVSGNFVFWFEEKDQVGWIVKEANRPESEKDGETLWTEGSILSKNHGRIVVLPYVKENGEFVQGHTKNAPHDGKALPRHKKEYVELPFKVLRDDLMIGLFGELNYE